MVRALVRFLRYLALLFVVLLAADLLALILVLPTAYLGAPIGVPVTVALLALPVVVLARRRSRADELMTPSDREGV